MPGGAFTTRSARQLTKHICGGEIRGSALTNVFRVKENMANFQAYDEILKNEIHTVGTALCVISLLILDRSSAAGIGKYKVDCNYIR